jgi:hypothetical protein
MIMLLASVHACVNEFRQKMAVLESDPESPTFDNVDMMVNRVYFQFQKDLDTSMETVGFMQTLCTGECEWRSPRGSTESGLRQAYDRMDRMDAAIESVHMYVNKLSFGISTEVQSIQRTLYECLKKLTTALETLAGQVRIVLDGWLYVTVSAQVTVMVTAATQQMSVEIAEQAIGTILATHSSHNTRKLNLTVLKMRTQMLLAQMQVQNTRLCLENARLESLIAAQPPRVHPLPPTDRPIGPLKKKKAFKIDDVEEPQEPQASSATAVSSNSPGPVPVRVSGLV